MSAKAYDKVASRHFLVWLRNTLIDVGSVSVWSPSDNLQLIGFRTKAATAKVRVRCTGF